MKLKFLAVIATLAFSNFGTFAAEPGKPIRALYVTGGCCHDYANQKKIIPEGISARANVEWTIVEEGGSGTKHVPIEKSIYQNPDWAKGYDVVVHNECFADDADPEYIERFLKPHREGLPALVIHCTMHTFRSLKDDRFREFLGMASYNHSPQYPIDVTNVKSDHPVMKNFPSVWTTGNEELYSTARIFPNTIPLAKAADKKRENGQWVPTEKENTIIWLNTYGKARVFGTTLAHHNKTMENKVYLDLLARGLLWTCDQLQENGEPKEAYKPKAK